MCAILQAVYWSRQHQQDCHFSPFSLTLALSLLCFSSILLAHTIWQEVGTILSFLLRSYQATMCPGHSFLPSMAQPMSWAGRVHCSSYPLSHGVPFLPFISIFLGMQAYCFIKNFRHTGSSVFTKELLRPHVTRCVLSHLHCNEHSLLLNSLISLEWRVLCITPVVIQSRTLFISLCTVLL